VSDHKHDETAVATAFASRLLGVPVTLPETLATQVGYALLREEERGGPRDRWGNWDWPFSSAHREGRLHRPWLDEAILEYGRSIGVTPPLARWPGDRRWAVCLTHDVDGYNWRNARRSLTRWMSDLVQVPEGTARAIERAGTAVANRLRRRTTAPVTAATRHIDTWLTLESRLGFRSTFLVFPPEVTARHPWDCNYDVREAVPTITGARVLAAILRDAVADGWEVGLHGSYHSAADARLLRSQREQIEDAVQVPVTSTRQHYLHYDPERTPECQAQAGLLTDSTQGFNRGVGFRAGTAFPYFAFGPTNAERTAVLEIPMHLMDSALFGQEALAYDVDTAIAHGVQLLSAVEAVGGVLTLNWHTDYVANDREWAVWTTLLEEAAHRNAWGTTMDAVRRHWIGAMAIG
jgi:hypothetical protein